MSEVASRDPKSPMFAVTVNLDDVIFEVVGGIRDARERFGIVSNMVTESLNGSMETTVSDVVHIIGNVRTITENMAQTSGVFYQPLFVVVVLFIMILLLLLLLFFCFLRTREEYHKRPLRIRRRIQRWRKRRGDSVEPSGPRRSESALSNAEEGNTTSGYSTVKKKKHDTLV